MQLDNNKLQPKEHTMHRFLFMSLLITLAPTAHSADPLAQELNACQRFCSAQKKEALGIKSTRFDGTYGRACVCHAEQPNKAKAKPMATAKSTVSARAAAANRVEAELGEAREERAPSDEDLLEGIADCNSPAVKACADRGPLYNVPTKGLPQKLPANGRYDVTIVEISDFQCPFCARAHKTLKRLKNGPYGQRIRHVFMHNPLGFHQRAMPAALAAAAAQRQGHFWSMHEGLFKNIKDLTDERFQRLARIAGLDMLQFNNDLKDPALRQEIERQQALAKTLGSRGTPGFFINGRLLRDAQPLDAFEKEVRFAIADALRVRRTGTRDSKQVYDTLVANGLNKAAPKAEQKNGAKGKAKPPAAPVTVAKDSIRGRGKWPAKVVIVIYSDFECPFCARVTKVLDQIEAKYGSDVYFIFRHNPLGFHKNAESAARATEAAGLQGKFWPMHDKLFKNYRKLGTKTYERAAKELGLNLKRFRRDMASKTVAAKVQADKEDAARVGARGTPNFFINGTPVRGALPFEHFERAIDKELKRANELLKKGVSRRELHKATHKR
jgi:protein-disulfide isomerase